MGIPNHAGLTAIGYSLDTGCSLLATRCWQYRCGMLGQLLYLEAEAIGMRGTGMGFFDDCGVLEAIGLNIDSRFQDFYHFGCGIPERDDRLV